MGFASAWLEGKALFPEIIKEAPDKDTGIIVVIPAFDEPGIKRLLDSLSSCDQPKCSVEVIVVVNAPADATNESLENNLQTIINIESWKRENKNCFFRLFAFTADSAVSGWGVGMARKTGMDEAVRRFNALGYPDGVILNLDADCLVEKNYFVSVYDELLVRKDREACSIYFEHPVSGEDFPETVFNSIILYELHLRYYFQGLAYSGFPWVFHTVGSAIAVKALHYIKAGGMNRRRAGEDFYFIQKLVPAGGYFNLNSTTVYPSPRVSFRVPFGTGASVGKLTRGDYSTLLTYNILAFKELKLFFASTEKYFHCPEEKLGGFYRSLPEGLKLFSDENEWVLKMIEIKNNTSGLESYNKRFFGWFNMFRIVKYLNFVHQDYFEKIPVEMAGYELLDAIGIRQELKNPASLLSVYRNLEKNS
jgi:cellulose synthase/poly-beta-1,6-N-acetylglucosamine synthase-like glycosyltransferase